MLIDPLEEHIPHYLQYMDTHELQIHSCFLTSNLEDFNVFIKDLKGVKRAFTDDFKVRAGFE